MKKKKNIARYDIWDIRKQLSEKELKSSNKVVEELLNNRGIDDADEFFNPRPPFDLTLDEIQIDKGQVSNAVKRIKKAIKQKEEIIIYGDYDADGITATAILWEALYNLEANILPFIPSRFEDGYGIKYETYQGLKEDHPNLSLIITVDNGIVANEDCEKIQEDGTDVVITDHHQEGDEIPNVHAVVHSTKITGAAVSWILAREVYDELNVSSENLQKSLDLVAIGTIADIADLRGPNRSFTYHGLSELNKLERVGLAALSSESGISPGQIASYTVGFILAPRLNAMGRLESAMDSLRLLCSKNRRKTKSLSEKLNRINKQRQQIVENSTEHALSQVGEKVEQNSIVVGHDSYHEGVIGLIASKLVEQHFLPSIVFSIDGKKSKASARSIPGFNIIENIRKLDHLIESGGGHPMAAGFTIKTENISNFSEEFEKLASKNISFEDKKKHLKVDLGLDLSHLSLDLAITLEKFNPVGPGNPTPSFYTSGLEIKSMRKVGKSGDHLKLIFSKDEVFVDAIAFGFGYLVDLVKPGEIVDVVYNLEANRWNGNVNLQMKVKDVRYHKAKSRS